MGNDDHYKFGRDPEKDSYIEKLKEIEALTKLLKNVRGTLNYIAVQGKLNHSGFNIVAKMNAEAAIKSIDKILPTTKTE